MKRLYTLVAMTVLSLLVVAVTGGSPAMAQSAPMPGPFSGWTEGLWSVLQPLVMLFVSIVGPALVTWVAVRVVGFLNIKDENERKKVEAQTREALHQAGFNAVKFALTKLGISPIGLTLEAVKAHPEIIKEAIGYLQSKNPGTIEETGLTPKGIEDIVLSKVPDVLSMFPQELVTNVTNVATRRTKK